MKLPARFFRNAVQTVLFAGCWLTTLAIIALVIFSYLLPQDLSKTTQPYATLVQISFFGRVLTYQLGLTLIFPVAIALMFRRRWLFRSAASLSLALLIPTLISLWPHNPPSSAGPKMRVMSMNLKYTHCDSNLIVDQVKNCNPDLLILEDYTPYAQTVLDKAFINDYPHRCLLFNWLQGMALYSRLPFDGGRPRTSFTKTRRQMRAVVDFHGRPIVIYIEHPFSPRSRQRIINNRVSTADLVKQVQSEKGPVIVAGDFNFTTETPNESALKAIGLQDGFELAGHGRGATWPVEPQWRQWLPGVRIDHIFVSRELTCTQFFVGQYDGSDHLPIVADIAAAPH
jgi:endonuclease/exonuclease/phosphatase (EEP) superfamily protein YafD